MPTPSTTPKQLRVAFFSDSLPQRNGTGAYYHDLLDQLRPLVEAAEVFQPLDIKRPPLLSWPMPGDPSQRLVVPNIRRIARAYRQLQPNIVVSITPGPFGLLGLHHARRSRAAFISAFHTDFEQLARIYWSPRTRRCVNILLNNLNRCLCKRSAAVLVNNSHLRQDVEALGARCVEVMGTPIQPLLLEKPLLPYPRTIKKVCFAGRLAPEKNIDRIIDAAAQLPEIKFLIGGDGPLRQQLTHRAAGLNNVSFHGWLNRESLIQLIDQSALLLLPSKVETFGSVGLEAMARGRPALVSANAGIHDWPQLRDGLFSYDLDRPLIQALRGILQLPGEQLRQKADNARAAAAGFNQQTIQQWLNVLAEYARADLEA